MRDEGLGPSEPPTRGEASNRHLLRWLKTVVVSEMEKAHMMRQVGIRKTIVVEVSLGPGHELLGRFEENFLVSY